MYIKYGNNIYELIHHRLLDRKLITTYHKVKADDSFCMISDYYAKDYEIGDENIQDIYEIDFFVVYNDTSETVKDAAKYVYESNWDNMDFCITEKSYLVLSEKAKNTLKCFHFDNLVIIPSEYI